MKELKLIPDTPLQALLAQAKENRCVREWAGSRTLRQFWEQCPFLHWLHWIAFLDLQLPGCSIAIARATAERNYFKSIEIYRQLITADMVCEKAGIE